MTHSELRLLVQCQMFVLVVVVVVVNVERDEYLGTRP
jgi:hypothetical protein